MRHLPPQLLQLLPPPIVVPPDLLRATARQRQPTQQIHSFSRPIHCGCERFGAPSRHQTPRRDSSGSKATTTETIVKKEATAGRNCTMRASPATVAASPASVETAGVFQCESDQLGAKTTKVWTAMAAAATGRQPPPHSPF
ncbi:hypothetical protein LXL04_022898 [Taraxacum kok-saghyz]